MKWSKDQSITLSRVCIVLFAAILLGVDIIAWKVIHTFYGKDEVLFMISIYTMSVCGWLCLWALWRLMGNLKKEKVFVTDNVRLLRQISWECAAVALICLASCLYYFPYYFVLAVAAAFMMLIVRIVKNIFEQAIAMKSELDLTI